MHAITLQWRRLTTLDWYWFWWNIRHIIMLTFWRPARTFICFGAHSNLDVLLRRTCLQWCITIAHPCAIYKHATTLQWWRLTTPDSYWFRWNIRHIVMLTLDEQRVRLFGFVHIQIWMCCCLVTMIAIAHQYAVFIYKTPLQWRRLTTLDWYWLRWNIRHIVMLTLNE